MKTLIITVGTRQVGWRGQDSVVRCFGADGDRSHPQHIDELYRELDIQRGQHMEENDTFLWSVRDLGKRYYRHCLDDAQENFSFSQVELLLDHHLIEQQSAAGLQHIILWGTDQPDTVSWRYRRADTLWLARLMAGKIQATWPAIQVQVLAPEIAVNDIEGIRRVLEHVILPPTLAPLAEAENQGNEVVLLIQNKGAAPTIAEGLGICAAGLTRQYRVVTLIPQEPPYTQHPNGTRSANRSSTEECISLNQYFWPLERSRVLSAWQRGDFSEAKIWLAPHQDCYNNLYALATCLDRATNWEIAECLNQLQGWLSTPSLEPAQIANWQAQLQQQQGNSNPDSEVNREFAQAWESSFLIERLLERGNYSSAFLKFAQTLERLLAIRYQANPPATPSRRPNFHLFIETWRQSQGFTAAEPWPQLFHCIRARRNDVVHEAKPLTKSDILAIWSENGFPTQDNPQRLFTQALQQACNNIWQPPQKTLLRSLYEWGLIRLQAESATIQP